MNTLLVIAASAIVGYVAGVVTNTWVHSVTEADDGPYAIFRTPTCSNGHELSGIQMMNGASGGGRRCPTCGVALASSWAWYPVATAVSAAITAAVIGPTLSLPAFLVLVVIGSAAAATDIRTMLIPKRLAWGGLAVGAVAVTVSTIALWATRDAALSAWTAHLQSAAVGAIGYLGLFFLINLIAPNGMGMGDVRLAAVLGLYLGWIGLPLVMWGILLGSVASLVIGLAARSWARRSEPFPYGPGMVLGTMAAIWFSTSLLA